MKERSIEDIGRSRREVETAKVTIADREGASLKEEKVKRAKGIGKD